MKKINSYYDPTTRVGENVNLVLHKAVVGVIINDERPSITSRYPVRKVTVGAVKPYAQYDKAVMVSFVDPGKRSSKYMVYYDDGIRYLTIEDQSGNVLYDSRCEVPIDMAKFNATAKRFGLGVAA